MLLSTSLALDKLSYAQDFASTTLKAQQDYALKLISTAKEISSFSKGERLELKILRLTTAGELAQNLIDYNREIATARISEAKRLSLLNVNTPEDIVTIENVALNQLNILNQTAIQQAILVNNALNNAIADMTASDNGIRYCLSDGTNCVNQTTSNLANYALKNQSETFAGNITTTQTGFFGWLGSLTSRITKLFVQDIDASGNLNVTGNITLNNKKVCLEDGTNCQTSSNTEIPVRFISTVNGNLMKTTRYLPLGTKATISTTIEDSGWIIDRNVTITGILWNADSNSRNQISTITLMKSIGSKSSFSDTGASVNDIQGSTKGSDLDFNVGFSQGDLAAIKYSTNNAGSGEIKDLSITLIGYYN